MGEFFNGRLLAEPAPRKRPDFRGAKNPFYGRQHTPAAKAKQSAATAAFNRDRRSYELKSRSVPEFNEMEAMYLAGLLDGKGTLGRCGRRPSVSVYSTDAQWLDALKLLYGGTRCKAGASSRRMLFVWQLTGARDVCYLLIRVLPHLRRQGRKASLMIAELQEDYGAGTLLRREE